MSIDLRITRTISTGVMFFVPHDEDKYDEIETTILNEFIDFDCDSVALHADDAEFCQYYITANIEDEEQFNKVCQWLLKRMEELGATLDYVA